MKKSNIFLASAFRTYNKIRDKKNQKKRIMCAISIIVLIAFLNMITGCFKYYYKVGKPKNIESYATSGMQDKRNYIILHKAEEAWHFKDITVKDNILEGNLETLPLIHMKYKTTDTININRYKKNPKIDESAVLNEVHIYVNEFESGKTNEISVPLSAIQKIEVYDPAVGATIASWFFGTIGSTTAVLAVIGIIVLLTKDSCPFVYTLNEESISFIGEIYGGAIYSSLERDDYMPLPGFKPVNGQYKLKISNEIKERQYTNLAELILIKHSKKVQVLIDKYGNVQTISVPQTPFSAISINNHDFKESLRAKDKDLFLFNEDNKQTTINSLILTFKNRKGSDSGKLVVHAKNSLWADYMYGQFTELFGTYYNEWIEGQKHLSTKKHFKRALKQDIPLSVYLETERGWKFVDFFHVVGPLAPRDMVMTIDLSKAKSKNVRIKLETGFMFWTLDYAAMDFSENIPVEVITLKPNSVIDEKGNDVSLLLENDDDYYLKQFHVGNEAILKYDVPKAYDLPSGTEQTIFLHSKGYYEKITDYKNEPDWGYLIWLKRPHSFTEFSKIKYDEVCKYFGIVTSKQ